MGMGRDWETERGGRVGEWAEKARSLVVSLPLLMTNSEVVTNHWGFGEDHFTELEIRTG